VAPVLKQEVHLPALDRIFCISVLEDLLDYRAALAEFYRLLKPGGLLVLTCDAQFRSDEPLHFYPDVNFDRLLGDARRIGFLIGSCDFDKHDAVHHSLWNLACWHGVFEK